MPDTHQGKAAQTQFSKQSAYYADSQQHSAGESLQVVREFVAKSPGGILLDVGTGVGFTAFGVSDLVTEVIATDISSGMLGQAEKLFMEQRSGNIAIAYAEAESLPFASGSLDVVTSRHAAHHFYDIDTAVQEFARVLKKGGVMIVIDPIAPISPAVDAWMNDVEVRRDPTHARDRTMDEWLALLETAGLTLDDYAVTKVYLEFDDWVKRSATPQNEINTLRRDFIEAAPAVVAAFNIRTVKDVITFHWEVLILRSVKIT